ncbi:putative Cytoskeleton-associated protein 5 [Hypsibius exemplaris]|uniref:Cytoskeleton-associated protein 5 n=1 Tax=Hypsibius exemplaris TaxID=2072580 RepID=A0A1W0X1E0_HYPEX|nr:putative Cytoskeleton-associated protein 5 [Hypsibius exemplaris]
MPDTVLQLQIDPVLLEIHLFLKQFPASHWPTAADDTPFRTVKTILYTLCRMYGSDVLNHLTLVEDPENSELLSFLKRVVKSVDRNGGPGGDRERQQNGETLATNGNAKKHADNLSNIINRLGSSDQEAVQQGLRELYEYREAHDVNLDDLLERTSEDFRKLITEGLRMIEFEQKDLGLPDSGMSEKGQSVINRLKGVISSPFLTAQDIESVKRMADNIKLEIRQGCFKTATQRVEDALRACDAQAYKSEDGATPRPPSILSPSRAMRPLDDNSPAGKPDNLDAIRARVKDYLKNKRN